MSDFFLGLRAMAEEMIEGTWRPSPTAINEYEMPENSTEKVSLRMGTWLFAERGCGTSACIIGHGMLDDRVREYINPTIEPMRYGCVTGAPTDALHRVTAAELEIGVITAQMLNTILFMPGSYTINSFTDPDKILREFIQRIDLVLSAPPGVLRSEVINEMHREIRR